MADLVVILIVAGIAAAIWRFSKQIRQLQNQDRMQADLPYLYIDGRAVGGANEVLTMAQSGKLQDRLAKGKIPHNASMAAALIKDLA